MERRLLITTGGKKWIANLAMAALIAAAIPAPAADAAKMSMSYTERVSVKVRVDARTGAYSVREKHPAWAFKGAIGQPLSSLKIADGRDALGTYREISFAWTNGAAPMTGGIRLYRKIPVVLFSETCGQASERPPPP
ncbi:MAG: hypothetical protein ACRED1_15105, partial [Limisphaerales bacterium]